jgi:hypothetical protein
MVEGAWLVEGKEGKKARVRIEDGGWCEKGYSPGLAALRAKVRGIIRGLVTHR